MFPTPLTPCSRPEDLRAAPALSWSPDEVAASWHVSPKTVRKLIRNSQLGAVGIGSALRVTSGQIADYLDKMTR